MTHWCVHYYLYMYWHTQWVAVNHSQWHSAVYIICTDIHTAFLSLTYRCVQHLYWHTQHSSQWHTSCMHYLYRHTHHSSQWHTAVCIICTDTAFLSMTVLCTLSVLTYTALLSMICQLHALSVPTYTALILVTYHYIHYMYKYDIYTALLSLTYQCVHYRCPDTHRMVVLPSLVMWTAADVKQSHIAFQCWIRQVHLNTELWMGNKKNKNPFCFRSPQR